MTVKLTNMESLGSRGSYPLGVSLAGGIMSHIIVLYYFCGSNDIFRLRQDFDIYRYCCDVILHPYSGKFSLSETI